ncbi:MAG: glycosyltransferase [Candidatus Omnitrophota bacterium]
MPRVSIILPVANGEKYISASIDSVLAQEFGDYELLICDDGSSDGTVEIVKSKNDKRIRLLLNKENMGLFGTLNRLLDESKGGYIRLWSNDDIMYPYCLKEETLFHERHPEIGFSYCMSDTIDGSGKAVMVKTKDNTPEIIRPDLAAQIMFYYGSVTANISTVLLKREALLRAGWTFRADLKQAGDFEMWARISRDYSIGFIKRPLIKLRIHDRQLSRAGASDYYFLTEDRGVRLELGKRLPEDIAGSARRYRHRQDCVRWAHVIVRNVLAGNIGTARSLYAELRTFANPAVSFLMWMITGNNRFLKSRPVWHVTGEDKGL